jgi:hypothetical protein
MVAAFVQGVEGKGEAGEGGRLLFICHVNHNAGVTWCGIILP